MAGTVSSKQNQKNKGKRLGLILGLGAMVFGTLFYWALATYCSTETREYWWWVTPSLGILLARLIVALLVWSGWGYLDTGKLFGTSVSQSKVTAIRRHKSPRKAK
jgi:hypothetical protein